MIAMVDGSGNIDNAATVVSVIGTTLAEDGSALNPSISFINSTDTGFYLAAVGAIGISAGGAPGMLTITANGITFNTAASAKGTLDSVGVYNYLLPYFS